MSSSNAPGSVAEALHRVRTLDPMHVNVLVAINGDVPVTIELAVSRVDVPRERFMVLLEWLQRNGWVVAETHIIVGVAPWAKDLVDALEQCVEQQDRV